MTYAKLKPIKLDEPGRSRPWMLSVPPALSGTGARKKLYFATKDEAVEAAELYHTNRDNGTGSLRSLTPTGLFEAANAFKLITDSPLAGKVTLLELVKAGLDVFSARTKSVTFKVLVDETLGAKLHRSTFYAERLRYVAGQFASINDKLVSDITPVDLEPTFAELRSRPATYNSAVRHLKVFFSYGKAMRYLQENPLTGRSIIEKPGDEVEVIPHHLVEAMLADALVNQLDLLPYLVFGFFCGIRPTGELRKLYWRNVDWEEREITVTSKASKTWQTRHIKISDNAIAWLERYQELGGSVDPEKEIVPFTYYQQRDRRAECWERISQGADWVQDGMRHTFASNHYALHKDINLICLQLGHSSPKMLDAHYRKGVKPKEAEIFWQIYPPANLEKKVVAFAAA